MKINENLLEEYSGIISYLIRSERHKQGLKAKCLADQTVSEATLSNIVNRTATVREDKIYHVLEKLGIRKEDIPKRIQAEHTEQETIRYYLKLSEALINSQQLEEAKKDIDFYKQNLCEYHPLYPFNQFLEGLYYLGKKEHCLAAKIFLNALDTCAKYYLNPVDNFASTCYSHLSKCKYQENDLEVALHYLEKGLSVLDESKENHKIKWFLLGNKVICMEKLGHFNQALQLVQEIWRYIDEVEFLQVKLNLYKSKANLLIKNHQLDDALQCASHGFQIAYNSPKSRYIFDFLMILGSIHLLQKDCISAEKSFKTATLIDDTMKFPRRHIDAYSFLAILYIYQQEWGKAKEVLDHAVTIGREVQDIHRLTRALIVNGNYFFFQNQLEEAIPYYEEAVMLAKENAFYHRQYHALFKLTDCNAALGNDKLFTKFSKELFYLQKKIELNREEDIYELH
ncbi:Tetratricopeptide repeat-containing protein [Seinonella peptonophila]|uniref:Tetratricopeptide repeat-containing protein n=1 Tax=Seinonella peptonophila TaxID=112248 RepID=A0A1M4Y8Z3_9BACL|nr:tetratricopeptide repeat protein [Seinonella peptonophila]SHF02297.1 Tetratricopeptide repeat-containing protein [Seinonella peptonophila]